MRSIVIGIAVCAAAASAWKTPELWDALSSRAVAGKQASGAFLVASEQLVRPWRLKAQIAGRPADLALDPSGRFAAVLNGSSVVTIDLVSGAELSRVRTRTTSYLGIAFRPGKREVWASETTRTGPDALLRIAYTDDGRLLQNSLERLSFPGHAIPAGLAFSADGATLYAALHHDNEIAVVDVNAMKVSARWASGLAPFSLVLNGGTLYVSNRGGRARSEGLTAPSGNQDLPTDAAGSVLEGTVQAFDIASGKPVYEVTAGRAVAGLALHGAGSVLVAANSHSDTLTVIDTRTHKSAVIVIDGGSKALPGLLPNAVAFRADGKRFYVALGGDNSVAAYEGSGLSWKLVGKIPSGWFPTAVAVDAKGGVHIASVKGVGNDEIPNAKGQHKSTVYEGSLSSVPDPLGAQLFSGSREAAAAARPKFLANGGGVRDLQKLGIEDRKSVV